MKVWEHKDEQGRTYLISVPSLAGRRRVAFVASQVPGVRIVRRPKALLSWFREEVFCEFDLDGTRYLIDEPFGDNSRYDIGRDGPFEWHPSFHRVVETFRTYRLWFGRRSPRPDAG